MTSDTYIFRGDIIFYIDLSRLFQAEHWLREQAQKEGWVRATKLQGRPMSQGLVGILKDTKMATMIEVQTDNNSSD